MGPGLRYLELGISIAAACCATVALFTALVPASPPVWMCVGFEAVALVGVVIGLLTGLERFREAAGLALACAGGTIASAAFLAWLGSNRGQIVTGSGERSIVLWLGAQTGAGVLLLTLGAIDVIARGGRPAWTSLSKGLLLGLPLALIGLAAWKGWLGTLIAKAPDWAAMGAYALLGIVSLGLLSAAGHFVIRAFEMGRTENGAG